MASFSTLPANRCECGQPADPRSPDGDECKKHYVEARAIERFEAARAARLAAAAAAVSA